MKAESDPRFFPKHFWLDEKKNTLVVIVTDATDGGGVFRDEKDKRRKYVLIQYQSDGLSGTRWRVPITEMPKRYKYMGPNPFYRKSEERWVDRQEQVKTMLSRSGSRR